MTTSRPGPATRVLHLAERAAWSADAVGEVYAGSTRGRSVAEVGFVHMSTAAQLPAVMAALYADVPAADLVLLVVDLPALAARGVPVRWENLEGGDVVFPHAYGALPREAVVAVLDLVPAEDGVGAGLPDLAGLGVLTGPPGA